MSAPMWPHMPDLLRVGWSLQRSERRICHDEKPFKKRTCTCVASFYSACTQIWPSRLDCIHVANVSLHSREVQSYGSSGFQVVPIPFGLDYSFAEPCILKLRAVSELLLLPGCSKPRGASTALSFYIMDFTHSWSPANL